jgi:hypothetical protein
MRVAFNRRERAAARTDASDNPVAIEKSRTWIMVGSLSHSMPLVFVEKRTRLEDNRYNVSTKITAIMMSASDLMISGEGEPNDGRRGGGPDRL